MSSSRSKQPVLLTQRKEPVLLTERKTQLRSSVSVTASRWRVLRAPAVESGPGRAPAKVSELPARGARQPAPRTRLYPRWPNLVQVSLESDHNFYCGFFREVGSSGLFVATYTAVPLGEVMLVSFTLPDREGAVGALCEARWIREYTNRTAEFTPGVGFGFLRIDAEALAAVSRFMARREPIFWDG